MEIILGSITVQYGVNPDSTLLPPKTADPDLFIQILFLRNYRMNQLIRNRKKNRPDSLFNKDILLSKKSCPYVYRYLLYENGQEF